MELIELTPENIPEESLFCSKNPKDAGFHAKKAWYQERYAEGLRMKMLKDSKPIGYIEYGPAEHAWRPVNAPGFMFIQCIYVYGKPNLGKGYGSQLLADCEQAAHEAGMDGVCTMTSKGTWAPTSQLYEKNGYQSIQQRGRFELLAKKWNRDARHPELYDWTMQQPAYSGWHLTYANQCPWHKKSVQAISKLAEETGIDLHVEEYTQPIQAQHAPSGFGVFNLLHDGRLLADHYISATRFKNILAHEGVLN